MERCWRDGERDDPATGTWRRTRLPNERFKPAFDEYERMTGFRETNVNALWHHRLSLYGPPCKKCGRLLRTVQARHCAECGAAV